MLILFLSTFQCFSQISDCYTVCTTRTGQGSVYNPHKSNSVYDPHKSRQCAQPAQIKAVCTTRTSQTVCTTRTSQTVCTTRTSQPSRKRQLSHQRSSATSRVRCSVVRPPADMRPSRRSGSELGCSWTSYG